MREHERTDTYADYFHRTFRRLRRYWAKRQAIHTLSQLEDRVLKDIGVDRYDIPAFVERHLDRAECSPTRASHPRCPPAGEWVCARHVN
ncbi:MAG: DUF1127 domain-containing protein [Gammaproteobacteria bacterium]|nr:DUF1127 domain-containing protein [Gammaproteobacteria bacterium]